LCFFYLGQEDTVQFFADNELHVAASLPCYSAKNVNTQRGSGVFDRSIHALLMLNETGYGKPGTGLHLDLVYNPLGKSETKKFEIEIHLFNFCLMCLCAVQYKLWYKKVLIVALLGRGLIYYVLLWK
jgi:hypothetical protein